MVLRSIHVGTIVLLTSHCAHSFSDQGWWDGAPPPPPSRNDDGYGPPPLPYEDPYAASPFEQDWVEPSGPTPSQRPRRAVRTTQRKRPSTGRAAATGAGGRRYRDTAEQGFLEEGEFDEDEGEELAEFDVVEDYMQSMKGKAVVALGAAVAGAGIGAIASESTVKKTRTLALAGLAVGLILSAVRGAFGDLFRALGLGLYFAIIRSSRVGSMYPLGPQLRAMLSRHRVVFPPGDELDSPWKYRPAPGGVEFSMAKAILGGVSVGALCGYMLSRMVWIIPTFLAALVLSGVFGYGVTLSSPLGDLLRLTGMRVVYLIGMLKAIDGEVMVWRKATVVGRICFSRLIDIDSRYQITRKLGVALSVALFKIREAIAQARGTKLPPEPMDDFVSEEELDRRRRPPTGPRGPPAGPGGAEWWDETRPY